MGGGRGVRDSGRDGAGVGGGLGTSRLRVSLPPWIGTGNTHHELPPLCHLGPARLHPRAALRRHSGQEWLHAVQALMVLAMLFSSFAFVLFMYQLYTMERGGLFYATGVCQLLACISVFTAALIYTIHVGKFHLDRQPGGSFGYCFVLAWLAFPLALLSGVMYIHLRKRE
ncbi:epithelial membrane protein 3 isoform X1 [Chrysemys picta bellii]|uniref:epithelial membrane protein 3 isoform X1 n=1 Tax=Chrysemys picta bellii TaxID=8478 RepID=UPI0032B12AB5